jgi:hypothetical protein
MSYNVSAVYEPPEPTAAAQEVPRPSKATPFIGCVAGARKRAVRNTQRVICSVTLSLERQRAWDRLSFHR